MGLALDRIWLLTASIIEQNPEATAAVFGLVALIGRMSDRFSTEKKASVAELLRVTADLLDHELDDAKIALLSSGG